MALKKPIAVTMGDAAGIGPEVVLKALLDKDVGKKADFAVLGNSLYLSAMLGRLGRKKSLLKVFKSYRELESGSFSAGEIPVLNFDNLPSRVSWGKVSPSCGRAAAEYIEEGVKLALDGRVAGLVTSPVSKEAITKAGRRFSGHTEFIAGMAGSENTAMMLLSGSLRVVLVTRHIPLKRVCSSLTVNKILRAVELGNFGLKKLGIKNPRLAMASLNPHGGEGGILGEEEKTIIRPAVKILRKKGISISEPQPADTLFTPRNLKKYDGVIAMYHDQGLIPLKTRGFHGVVNITWGLPFVRTSPGHGTAFDIAGKGKADCRPMKESLVLAAKLAFGKGSCA